MITAKLRRGPLAGKFITVESYTDRIEAEALIEPKDYRTLLDWKIEPENLSFSHKRGHYQRTNIRTKSGAYVYEWMGFYGEIQK